MNLHPRRVSPPTTPPLPTAYRAAGEKLRLLDQDRYLSALFAPSVSRPHLFALFAFAAEIARVRDIVSDPLPGEMRFQWWRDHLLGEGSHAAEGHPLADALVGSLRQFHLPVAPLIALIEARTFDLYDDPMPTWLDCEGYCGETASVLIRLACLVLAQGDDPGGAEAAGHAGVAYALTGLLRAFPWHARRRQAFLPKEAFNAHGVSLDDVFSGRDSPALRAMLGDVRDRARAHLERTRALIGTVPPRCCAAFLPVALVEPYLKAMEAPDYQPFATRIDRPSLAKLWTMLGQWQRARRGGP